MGVKELAKLGFERDRQRDKPATAVVARPCDSATPLRHAATALRQPATTPPATPPAWMPEDWRAYYVERAGIRQFDGCYPRELADRRAWRETANRWWHEHGSRVAAPVCAGCLLPVASADSIPLPHGQRVHDADCIVLFGRRWLAEAAAALEGMGIPTPRGYLPDEGAP